MGRLLSIFPVYWGPYGRKEENRSVNSSIDQVDGVDGINEVDMKKEHVQSEHMG